MSTPAPAAPHWPITLVLVDGQRLQVRLYERQELPDRWVYKIGMPAYVTVEGGRVQPSEYTVWVTADLLEPMWAVNYPAVPSHRLPAEPPPEQPGWMLRVRPGGRRGAVVHESGCEKAAGGGQDMDTLEALDALMRPGVDACHECAAAVVLIQALELGSGYA
ncbi:DUF6233 domain-containing protein [Streptomyces sp. NPDC001581]|uniref:DUF6233 domain-containing protein n=1 Tax=Streptomyces sp. NPDC001581 TaxID=3154386 RepID=UPI00331C4FA6